MVYAERQVVYVCDGLQNGPVVPDNSRSSHQKGAMILDGFLGNPHVVPGYTERAAEAQRKYKPWCSIPNDQKIVFIGSKQLRAEDFKLRSRQNGKREKGRSGSIYFSDETSHYTRVAFGKIDPRLTAYVTTAGECRKLGFEPRYAPSVRNALHVTLMPTTMSTDADGQILPEVCEAIRAHLQERELQ